MFDQQIPKVNSWIAMEITTMSRAVRVQPVHVLPAFALIQGASLQTQMSSARVDIDSGKVVVYGDTYGIPHIFAPAEEQGLYAMGWAQAEGVSLRKAWRPCVPLVWGNRGRISLDGVKVARHPLRWCS